MKPLSLKDLEVLSTTIAQKTIRPTLACIHLQDGYYFTTDSFRAYRTKHDGPSDITTNNAVQVSHFYGNKSHEQTLPLSDFFPILDAIKTKVFKKVIFSPSPSSPTNTTATLESEDQTITKTITLKDTTINTVLNSDLFYGMLKPFHKDKEYRNALIVFKQDTPLSPFQFMVHSQYEGLIMPLKY